MDKIQQIADDGHKSSRSELQQFEERIISDILREIYMEVSTCAQCWTLGLHGRKLLACVELENHHSCIVKSKL
jgi:hypothetical protein